MKKTILLFLSFGLFVSLYSCQDVYIEEVYYPEEPQAAFVEDYDLWYVDYHQTLGEDTVPYMKLAFTLSFKRGNMFANNNISEIGYTGNGYGIQVGNYSWVGNTLHTQHDIDGVDAYEITQISQNEIEMYHHDTRTTYFLIGYEVDEFDYDKLFYENIEYLLQDFEIWTKTVRSPDGWFNEFDYENYLKFTPEYDRTFYASNNTLGTNIDFINWNYSGAYEVFDVEGYENLKILTLSYDSQSTETFELVVINDSIVELFHIASGTTYSFEGSYFIQYLKNGRKESIKRNDRERTKIKRRKYSKIS